MLIIDFKMMAQVFTRLAKAKTVRPQYRVGARHPASDAIRQCFHVVGNSNDWSGFIDEQRFYVGYSWLLQRVQSVVLFTGFSFPRKLCVAGNAPDMRGNSLVFQ